MIHLRPTLVALGAASLFLAACGSGDDAPSTTPVATITEDSMVDDMTEDSMVDDMTEDSMVDDMTEDSMVEEGGGANLAELPAWQTAAITDVEGEVFTLADYVGRPVLVETFATWCSSCRAQLGRTQAAAAALGDDAAVIALSVETDLDPAAVADYADDNGFTAIRFAVVSPDLLAALADAFGATVANPPATPKLIIDAMGHAGSLSTGSEPADELIGLLRSAGG